MLKPAVIIDNGSSFMWTGFAGQKKPKFVLRTMFLHACSAGTMREAQQNHSTAESMASFAVALRSYPPKQSIIEDWDSMENLWSHLFFCGLRAPPEEQAVLMADSSECPTTNREKVAEVLFEHSGVPALHMANTGFLSLCTYVRVTGLAVEAGAGVSHVTSVCLGQTQWEATYHLRVAGGFLSSYLHSLLMDSTESSVLKALKRKTVIQMKKQCCYVSMGYKGDLQNQGFHHPARFQAPDGHCITLHKERFCCPELLFQPELLHQSSPRLHYLAWQSLQKVPDHTKGDMVGNIVLSGGSSMFPGFPKRMCLELNALFHDTGCQIQVLESPERGTAVWAGCSIAASLTSFQKAWMVKGEYEEHGVEYMHRIFQ